MSKDFLADRFDNHDIQCGKMAGQLIKMSFFTEEFVSYGTAFWKNGHRWYYVSNYYKKVHDFIRNERKKGVYCTPIEKHYKREQVLAGESERMKRKNKLDLVKMLQQEFSEEMFQAFSEFAYIPNTDVVKDLLDTIRTELSGTFDYDALNVFKSINEYAYDAKKISLVIYLNNQRWIKDEQEELKKNMVRYDNHSRQYSGFAYLTDNGDIKYYDNALFDLTAIRRDEMILKGTTVTPIFEKQYFFCDIAELPKMSDAFTQELKQRYDQNYFLILQYINQLPSPINKEAYLSFMEKINDMGTEKEIKLVNYYKNLWTI